LSSACAAGAAIAKTKVAAARPNPIVLIVDPPIGFENIQAEEGGRWGETRSVRF
jgi:hypothetical protein